jgi:hypothetical protein
VVVLALVTLRELSMRCSLHAAPLLGDDDLDEFDVK